MNKIKSTIIKLENIKGLTNYDLCNLFYYISFTALCLWQALTITNFKELLFIKVSIIILSLKIICVVFLVFKVILELLYGKLNIKQYILSCFVLLILLISYTKCKNATLLITFLYISFGRSVDIRQLAKITFIVWTFIIIITVTSSMLGYIETLYDIRSNGQIRSSMGFKNPNRFSTSIFQILLAWLFLRYDRVKIVDFILSVAAIIIIQVVSGSRTTSIAIGVMIFLIIFSKQMKKRNLNKIFIILLMSIVMLLFVITLYFMFFYDDGNQMHVFLDRIVSKRFSLAHNFFTKYPPTFFGQYFEPDILYDFINGTKGTFIIDNSYAKLIILFGLFPTVLIFLVFFLLIRNELKCNSIRSDYLFFIIFLIVGFAESFILNISMNFTLIIFSNILINSQIDLLHKIKNVKFKKLFLKNKISN